MRRLAFPVAALCGLALAVVPAIAENKSVQARMGPNRFEPKEVAVKPGEKVTISNTAGNGLHNVHWDDRANAEVDVGPQWSVERTFDAAGTYRFYCEPHGGPNGSGMSGVVHVNDAGTVPTGGGGTGTTTGGTGTTGTQTQPPPTTGTTTSTTPGTNPLPPPPPDDRGAPRVSNARAIAGRRVVVVRFTISEAATVNARLYRGLRRVARRTFEVERGSVRLRLRVRHRLAEGRYRVRLVLVDAAGNRATRTLSARVR